MRALLAGELSQAQSYSSEYYVKLEVQNGSGTWIDVGAALGTHWIVNATWGADRDTPVAQATFTLVRNIGAASLAPLMSASVLNVDDTPSYSPLLNIGRLMRAFTATMPWDVALDTGKYRPALTGRITDVFVLDDAEGRASMITLPCSDLGGWLMDLQIETEGTEYGNPTTPPALESVLQAVIDANIPTGEPAVTLVKQSSSSFGVTGWKQGETKLLEALRTLVLDSTGEDLRYRFDSSHVSQLMWFNPDRSRVTVDATFTKDQYRMSRLDLSLMNIRNAGSMAYIDSATGTSGVVTAEDAASIGAPGNYRRRFFRLPSSKMLATEAESQTVIDAVVNDLSGPPAEAQVQLPFSWYVQLYDRYMFEANGRQYDQDQTFAVGGYQHTIENGRGSTVLTPLTSRIVGAYAAWSRRLPFLAAAPPVLSASFDATGQLIINSSGDPYTASQKIAWATGSTPSDATVRAAAPIAQQLVSGLATGSVYPAGTTVFIAAFAYSANGLESTPLSAISVTSAINEAVSLNNFKVIAEATTTLTYGWIRGERVDEVWAAQLTFTNPLPADPWAAVITTTAPLADGVDAITVTKPPEGSVLFLQVEPRTSDLTAGEVRRVVVNSAPTQVPHIELDDIETDTVGTQWWKITERGIAVTTVEVQTQIGAEPISGWVAPTRVAGAASTVRGGLLGAGEYEHDVTLDTTRTSWIMPRLQLSNGAAPIVLGPFGFDRDKNPNLLSVTRAGTILTILGDSNTKSLRVFDTLGTWQYELDGVSAVIDVSKTGTNAVAGLGAAATSIFRVEARSDPTAYVTGSTLTDSLDVVIGGGGAPPATALWDTPGVSVRAPTPIGSAVVVIKLEATAAPSGSSVKLYADLDSPDLDVTSFVTPALSVPPTSETSYSLNTGYPFVHDPPRVMRNFYVKADLLDSLGNVMDSRTVHASWFSSP